MERSGKPIAMQARGHSNALDCRPPPDRWQGNDGDARQTVILAGSVLVDVVSVNVTRIILLVPRLPVWTGLHRADEAQSYSCTDWSGASIGSPFVPKGQSHSRKLVAVWMETPPCPCGAESCATVHPHAQPSSPPLCNHA